MTTTTGNHCDSLVVARNIINSLKATINGGRRPCLYTKRNFLVVRGKSLVNIYGQLCYPDDSIESSDDRLICEALFTNLDGNLLQGRAAAAIRAVDLGTTLRACRLLFDDTTIIYFTIRGLPANQQGKQHSNAVITVYDRSNPDSGWEAIPAVQQQMRRSRESIYNHPTCAARGYGSQSTSFTDDDIEQLTHGFSSIYDRGSGDPSFQIKPGGQPPKDTLPQRSLWGD